MYQTEIETGEEFAPVLKSNKSHMNLILDALDNDCHTLSKIRKHTNLTDAEITLELGILDGIETQHRPGPPVSTWWRKNTVPKGRIYIGAGGKVEVLEETPARDFTKEKEEKNAQIQQAIENFKKMVAEQAPIKPLVVKEKVQVLPEFKPVMISHPANESYCNLPLTVLRQHSENPREYVEVYDDCFIELTDSIREKGILEPLIVSLNPDKLTYRIIAGHRRFKAAEAAGLKEVPCIIKNFASIEEEIEIMLIENMQRQGLNYTQEARAFAKLLKNNDVHAVARRTGKTQSYIKQSQLFLKLSPEIQLLIDREELPLGTGLALAGLQFDQQKKLLPRVGKMTVKKVEELVKNVKSSIDQRPAKPYGFTPMKKERVTTDEEKFTRSGSIKSLEALNGVYFSPYVLQKAFDDICLDSCMEQKDQSICHSCPVPRFVESIVRRVKRGDNEK